MKKIFLGLAMGVMLALVACSSGPVHFSDLTQNESGVVMKGSSAFSGIVKSDDGIFFEVQFEKGAMKNMKAMHDNGKIAIITGDDGGFAFFDEEGDRMPEQAFVIKYSAINEKMEECFSQMTYK